MNLLRRIKRFLDKLLGTTKSDELFWKFRHFFDKDWPKSYINDSAINHPHRKLLIEKISEFYPFENVLELGSASGVNLFLLAKKFPNVKFYGIDVSEKAIEEGQKFFKEKGIKNVFLNTSSITDIKNFEDKSIDVVFSDAALIYIGKEKINNVLREMARVTRKGIILCEQHTDNEPFYDDKWVHNYKEAIKNIKISKVDFIKISKKVWDRDWGKYGQIVKIIL